MSNQASIDPEKTKRHWRTAGWTVLLAAGSIAWLLLLRYGEDPARVWRALLINFLYFTPLAAGLITWSAIVIAANGRWAGPAERLAWTGLGFLVPSFIILLVLWIGSPAWAPWYGKKLHQGMWLDNTVLFLREFTGLLVFWGTAVWFFLQRLKGRQRAVLPAAIVVVAFCIVFTLFSFDLVMALTPHWRSALFGAYFFISSLYLAAVFWTILVVVQPGFATQVRQDLGKLTMAFSILTTSFLFMQLLTIWYENLPEETSYLLNRMHQPEWMIVTNALLIIVYFGPLMLLVTEWAKTNRVFLGAVSILLLAGLWAERWWLVAPTFSSAAKFGLPELASAAACAGGLALSIEASRRFMPGVPEEEGIGE
jgi:hypothetical protein